MVNRERAVELRQQGYTYKEIASLMNISESWCKKELQDVVQKSAPSDATKLKAVAILEEALEKIRAL